MKITWFGNTAFRFHIGGQVVVVDADRAPGVDQNEVLSGADQVVSFSASLPAIGSDWRPRAAQRLLDAEGLRPVEVWSIGEGSLVLDADDERPLVLVTAGLPELDRWSTAAVMVITGPDLATKATAAAGLTPRLIALAGDEADLDAAIDGVRERLDGTGLVALERGLALEA